MKDFSEKVILSTKQNGFHWKGWFPIKGMAFTKRDALPVSKINS